jgi:hypothetical protein
MNSPLWVELEGFLQEIDGFWGSSWENLTEISSFFKEYFIELLTVFFWESFSNIREPSHQ